MSAKWFAEIKKGGNMDTRYIIGSVAFNANPSTRDLTEFERLVLPLGCEMALALLNFEDWLKIQKDKKGLKALRIVCEDNGVYLDLLREAKK
jgi:hypothetical protein